MKKKLLKISLLLMCLVGGIANAQTCDEIKLFYSNGDGSKGAEIADAGQVKLGSTLHVELTTSAEAGEVGNIIFMQLAGEATWVKTHAYNNLPSIPQGASQITDFTFEVKTDGNAALGASFFKVIFKDLSSVNIGGEGLKAVTFTDSDPLPEVSSTTLTENQNVLLGSAIDFTIDYTLVESGTYTLSVFQSGLTENSNGGVVYIAGKTDYVLESTAGSFNFSSSFQVSAFKGGGDEAGDCIDGIGNLRFRLVKDGVASGVADKVVNVNFTTTPTSTGGVYSSESKIYPNPASSQVFVEAEEGSVIEICNVAGSVVKSLVATSSKQNISVANFAKGMYVVKVTTNGIAQTTKLLVK